MTKEKRRELIARSLLFHSMKVAMWQACNDRYMEDFVKYVMTEHKELIQVMMLEIRTNHKHIEEYANKLLVLV